MQALGVLLYLMCFRKFPYPPDAKLQVLSGQYEMPPSRHREDTRALVRAMLHNRPSQRPDIDQVIRAIRAGIDGGRMSPLSQVRILANITDHHLFCPCVL
jgi:serine/threonine protein kinase